MDRIVIDGWLTVYERTGEKENKILWTERNDSKFRPLSCSYYSRHGLEFTGMSQSIYMVTNRQKCEVLLSFKKVAKSEKKSWFSSAICGTVFVSNKSFFSSQIKMQEVAEEQSDLFQEYKYKIELTNTVIGCFILKLTDTYRLWIGRPTDLSLYNLYANYESVNPKSNTILLYSSMFLNRDQSSLLLYSIASRPRRRDVWRSHNNYSVQKAEEGVYCDCFMCHSRRSAIGVDWEAVDHF